MKAIIVRTLGEFEYTDVPRPEPGPDEVLVKVHLAGLCRTDLKLIEKGHRDLTLPRIPAEEVVGHVVQLGTGVPCHWLSKRVYLYPGTSCGTCPPCQHDAGNLCHQMRIMGFHRDGGFAEYVAAPAACLIEIPSSLEDDAAVFAEPLSCCLNALELSRLQPGEQVGVWGAGTAGTLLSRGARFLGARCRTFDPDPSRHRNPDDTAAPPRGLKLDVALVAVGHDAAYQEALELLAPRGRLILFSGLPREHAIQSVDFNRLHYLEQTLTGAYGCSFRHGQTALQWINRGQVEVRDLVTHRMPLSQLGAALDLVRHRKAMKILLYPTLQG